VLQNLALNLDRLLIGFPLQVLDLPAHVDQLLLLRVLQAVVSHDPLDSGGLDLLPIFVDLPRALDLQILPALLDLPPFLPI